MSDSAHDPHRIAEYLRTRLEYLRNCRMHIENKLSDESREFINTEDDEDTIERFLLHIDGAVAITFRYSMLISACSYLEEALKLLCRKSISDYRSKLTAIKKGSWLSKHRSLLEDEPSVDIAAVEECWDTMANFVLIRNCITHGWGNVNECRNSKQVREIVAANEGMYAVSKDGYLLLDENAVTYALIASKEIVGKLLEDLFSLSKYSI